MHGTEAPRRRRRYGEGHRAVAVEIADLGHAESEEALRCRRQRPALVALTRAYPGPAARVGARMCDPQAAMFLETPVIPGLDEQAVPDLAQDLVGQQVGRYTIRAPIGSGGMGVVFLAEQERRRRVVALKVMRTAMASRAAVRRFEYEAEVLGRLQHPNIAQIHEASVHPGAGRMGALPFFAAPSSRPASS